MRTSNTAARVGLAACFHETNTFSASNTDEAGFKRRGWLVGQELVDAYAGTRTVIGGMLDGAAEHSMDVVPVFGAYATPAGTVTASAFHEIMETLRHGLERARPLDGLLLELHGAMVVEGEHDPETVLLHALRDTVGPIPVAAVTDLHANMTRQRVRLIDVLVGYRTNPHIDTYECGIEATTHLHHLTSTGLRTTLHHRAVPVLAAPIAQRTAEPPLRQLIATARELQRRHQLIDVTVHGGYAYADVPHAGMSFTVTAPQEADSDAEETLETLARQAWELRGEFTITLPDADEAVRRAVELAERTGGPIAIADTGDNINGGGPGDTTWLLHAALANSARPIAATLCDPAAVAAASQAGLDGVFHADLGGKAEQLSGSPIQLKATVRWLGQGTFTNTGPMARGAQVDMGRTAVVSIDNADVILQSMPIQPNDPELFRSVGLDPADYTLLLLKGAAALRAGWSSATHGFIDAGTPGITDSDLSRLPYRELHRVWPLQMPESQEGNDEVSAGQARRCATPRPDQTRGAPH